MSQKISTQTMVRIGIFTAVIVILSQISIPMPSGVPITLQTFAIALAGVILGWRYGLLSILIYILLGAVGIPVFANFQGGLSRLVGMTGGFIWGFIPLIALSGIKFKKYKYLSILFAILGLFICHFFGVLQFSIVAATSFMKSLMLVSVPYILKDIISVVVAFFIGNTILKRI